MTTEPDARETQSEETEPGGKLDEPIRITEILDVLPHRYPILLVDRVVELDPGKRIVALKNVTINEPYFAGHFPGHPVVPGVMLIEGMAQAGGVLLLREVPDREDKLIYFIGIEKARFRRPVVPGDQVRYEVEVLHKRASTCKMSGKVLVDGKVSAEAVILSAMVDR